MIVSNERRSRQLQLKSANAESLPCPNDSSSCDYSEAALFPELAARLRLE